MQFIRGILVVGLVCFVQISTAQKCGSITPSTKLTDMVDECTKKMRDQVQIELTAAMTYLSLGAHFSRDVVNRPGFAKMFFENAREERDHAIKVISYLLMRGELTEKLADLIQNPAPKAGFDFALDSKNPGLRALQFALKLEKSVTTSIRGIIKTCEDAKIVKNGTKGADGVTKTVKEPYNDYHLVDYLTADFLDEQYKGQREIASKTETLHKLNTAHGYDLGEFLFDKKLLNGEPL